MLAHPALPMTVFCVLTLAHLVVYDRLVRRQYAVARDASVLAVLLGAAANNV